MAIREYSRWHSRLPGSGPSQLSRRRLLLAVGSTAAAVVRAAAPEPTAFDLSLLDELAVHNELFYVRDHFPAPAGASSAVWKVAVRGAVEAPREFGFEQLTSQPAINLGVTLECAENPPAGGLVSHAVWRGTPLAALLKMAQPSREATHVVLSGADGFRHALPIAQVASGDALLAWSMNGEKLPRAHGFPVRAIVPGWYGMASVKWLDQVEVVTAAPAQPEYQRLRKSFFGTREDGPVGPMQVKSAFCRPVDGAILTRKGRFVVRGVAWAGPRRVARVEVSADGGKTWQPATLNDPALPFAWTRWSWNWTVAAAGEYELAVRATDDAGNQQPLERMRERADPYEQNQIQPVHVTVTL